MSQSRSVNQQVLAIAWPMILAGASVPLLGIADTAILGHLPSPHFLSAVAVGSSAVSLLLWLLGFLRMGTTGPTARAFGANNLTHCVELLWQSLILAVALGLAIIVLHQPIINGILWLLGPGNEIYQTTWDYTQIRLLAAPASLCNFAMIGWLLGLQRAKSALAIMFSANALNIGFDFLFIMGFGLNSDGAAWASLLSEYIGVVIAWLFVRSTLRQFSATASRDSLTRLSTYTELLLVNRDLFLRTACLVFTFTFFTAQGARLGNDIVAANAILMQLVLLLSYGLDGFAHAAETLTGNAIGSRSKKHFYQICHTSAIWGGGIALLATLLFWLFQQPIVNLFTNIAAIAEMAHRFYPWIIAMPLLACWCYLLDGVFLGAGQTTAMRNMMLLATLAVFLPSWWLTLSWGNQGLWFAFILFMTARSILMIVAFVFLSYRRWFSPGDTSHNFSK